MVQHYRSIVRLIEGRVVPEADIEAEEKLFHRALELREKLGDTAGIAQSLFGMGLVYQVLRNNWQAAMSYFTQALARAEEAGDDLDLYSRSEIHRHIGFFYLVEDVHFDRAIDHLDRSLKLRERLGDERRIPSALIALGQAELAAGRRTQAIELLERAVRDAREAHLSALWLNQAQEALDSAITLT
jgi:tetratricopeptide (TPR) repeat protein